MKTNKRYKEMLKMRKNRYTLQEIGDKYGLTRQGVFYVLKRGAFLTKK